ncbi:intracellular alkaline serine protease [Bacillus freudenreichii]|nr:intracellular alkaline serine protease [Bacillus freudenreichii]
MATPICAGVVAQLLQKESHLSPDQVKEKLIHAFTDMGLPLLVQGHGYLDAGRLI